MKQLWQSIVALSIVIAFTLIIAGVITTTLGGGHIPIPAVNLNVGWLKWVLVIMVISAVVFFTLAIAILSYDIHKKRGRKSTPETDKKDTGKKDSWLLDKEKSGLRLFVAWVILNLFASILMPELYWKGFILNHFWIWLGINGILGAVLAVIWAGTDKVSHKARYWLTALAVVAVVIGVVHHLAQPPEYYDSKTGKLQGFYLDEETGKVYSKPGYSPITGEELRLGTKSDVEKLGLDQSWLEKLTDKTVEAAESVSPRSKPTVAKTPPKESKTTQSFSILAPPAPEWTRPITEDELPRYQKWHFITPRMECRVWLPKAEPVVADKNNHLDLGDEWMGMRFQSTSNKPEFVTFKW